MAGKGTPQELTQKSRRNSYGVIAACVILLTILCLYFFYLTQAYYFGTDNSYIVLRAGVPQLTFLPGFGRVVIQTDFKRQDLANDRVRQDIDRGKVQGFWFLHTKEGDQLWGDQLANCLEPVTRAKWLRLLGRTKFRIENFSKRIVDPGAISNSEQLTGANLDSFTSEMVQSLTARLSDQEAGTRSRAASTLRQLAEAKPALFTPEIVQSLTALLTGKDYVIYSDPVMLVLGPLVERQPEVDQSLIVLLRDKDSSVRSRAAFALEQLARNDPASFTPELVHALAVLFTDQDSDVRSGAVSALGQLAKTGPELFTPEVIQALINLLADEAYSVRSEAVSALGGLSQTGPELFTSEIVPSLTALLADREASVRSSAALAIGEFAATRPEFFTSEIVQALTPLLNDGGSFVPCSAASALRQLAGTRPEFFTAGTVQSLTARLADEDPGVRSNSASALGELAQTNPASFTPETVQALSILLSNEDADVRSGAASALGELTQKKPEITQALVALLKNGKDSNGRNGASEGLFVAALKDTSQKDFIDAELERLAKSPQPYLRAAASQTLEMIAIGDLLQEPRAHPDRIDDIESRLNDLKSLDESLHEEHLQFAAQIVLNEIDKIRPEDK
ncbi:MAG TPA: sister chromatid cohesion protein PDS5 [Anaerolineales bacterium]|nr:sister chromatid cohesion protein PDS5 [Anaerolineales bacterium]